jgi:1,4-dihydroxy-6-naphthoate synthase
MKIRIGHSPDPDDAFMWYPLAKAGTTGHVAGPRVDCGPFDFEHVLEDIQTLNERSERGELEVTALSIHQVPYVADRYVLTSCGASMGDGYGPMVVCRAGRGLGVQNLKDVNIAVPGHRTSAFMALSLLLEQRVPHFEVVPFDRIIEAVRAGEYEAGLIIHEGQLTYEKAGLECVVDLGRWWKMSTGLPLPLGGNAIRRDLGELARPLCAVLLRSIRYALDHRDESIAYALAYARDMGADLADRFVGMYVNHWTIDYGEDGRRAIARFLGDGAKAGLVPDVGEIDFVEP